MTTAEPPGVVCAGGAVLDRHLHLLAPAVAGTSNPARSATSPGGVARNVAENLALLGVRTRLVSRVGQDDAGRELLAGVADRGVDVSAVAVDPGSATAQYVAVLDAGGELVIGAAAMDVLERIGFDAIEAAWPPPGDWLFLDCNLSSPVIAAALARAAGDGTPAAVDAVSTLKVVRLAGAVGLAGVAVLFCNLDEARALLGALGLPAAGRPDDLAIALLRAGAGAVVITLGAGGAVVAADAGTRAVPAPPAQVVDVTGAGDALVAATLSGLLCGRSLSDAVAGGVRAAALTVSSPSSVMPAPEPAVTGPRIP